MARAIWTPRWETTLSSIAPVPGRRQELRPGHWRDEFGVVWNRTVDKDIGVVEHYPLGSRH